MKKVCFQLGGVGSWRWEVRGVCCGLEPLGKVILPCSGTGDAAGTFQEAPVTQK